MAMVGFDLSVKEIIKLRKDNPAIGAKVGWSLDPETVAGELEAFTRRRCGFPPADAASFFESGRSPFPAGEGAAAGANWFRQIVRSKTGLATLADWLGKEGKPVEAEKAEARAAICVNCPMNQPGDVLSFFTVPVANLIRKQLEERKNLNLRTSLDERIGLCDACGCPLHLKVHVPLDIIKNHIKPPEWNRLVDNCWMRTET